MAKYRYDVKPPEKPADAKQTQPEAQASLPHSPSPSTPVDDFLAEAQSQLNSLCEDQDFDNTPDPLPVEPTLTRPQSPMGFGSHLSAPLNQSLEDSLESWPGRQGRFNCASQVLHKLCMPEKQELGGPGAWNHHLNNLYGMKGKEVGFGYRPKSQKVSTYLPVAVSRGEQDVETVSIVQY